MATKGTVLGVIANMVTLTVDGPVAQNEICYISTGGDRLMAEVIKVVGKNVYVQVFESTRGLKVGAEAEFTGHMLEVTLGPGMLSKNYDGLQNDLDKMEGVFLKRGQYTYPLDKEKKWLFKPIVKAGDEVGPSAWLGEVEENHQPLKIMVPFQLQGDSLTETETEYMAFSAKLMTYECGIRFLGDYLNGDVYFKTDYPEHNLVRAKTQFALVADMEKKMDEMRRITENALK